MQFSPKIILALAGVVLLGAPRVVVGAESVFAPQGGEYRISGELAGEQVRARIALGEAGGYVVWQDNYIDGNGLGIGASRLGPSFNPEYGAVRINRTTTDNQENPDIALLADGGAIAVWQGAIGPRRDIFAQVIRPDGTLGLEQDLRVSGLIGKMKIQPRVAATSNGGAVVAWGSFGQDDAGNFNQVMARMQGVYASILDGNGGVLVPEFQVNQRVRYNQRNPAVATLQDGRIAFVWVSEGEETITQDGLGLTGVSRPVDIVGRLFHASGVAVGNEFKINSSATNICAEPSIAARPDGGFTVVWNENDLGDRETSWDIKARDFAGDGSPLGAAQFVNSHRFGDQLSPAIAAAGGELLAVWTSMAQDGSYEGVYGQFLRQGEFLGAERRINSTTASRQILPAVAGVSDTGFIAVWSSFVGGDASVDLFAQRFLLGVPKPAAPMVSAVSQNRLSITWPRVEGFAVSSYELFEAGSSVPVVTANNWWLTPANLLPGTTKSYQVAYRLVDGRLSPLSDPAGGTTFAADDNFDGLPDDWQAAYWPGGAYPSVHVDSDGDGATNLQEFLAGTSPVDADDVLKLSLQTGTYGWNVNWNTRAGFIYQLQTSSDFGSWSNVGDSRFAVGSQDFQNVDGQGGLGYFRVIRVR